jgi:uncharacterized protein YdeI (YjbR/CyaY-like superfamily)
MLLARSMFAIPACCSSSFHREPGVTNILSWRESCFVNGCEEVVTWAGWWYCVNGFRHQAQSCDSHSDHADFTPTLTSSRDIDMQWVRAELTERHSA